MLDLPFGFVSNQTVSNEGPGSQSMQKVRSDNFSNGDVVMFSGCEDDQTSADVQNTAAFGDDNTGAGGAATEAFTWALLNTTGLDYLNILLKARDTLEEKGFTQVPQLSSSKPLDLDKPFSLFGTVTANEEQMQQQVPVEFRRRPPPPTGPHRRPWVEYPQQGQRGFGQGPMTAFRRGQPGGGWGGPGFAPPPPPPPGPPGPPGMPGMMSGGGGFMPGGRGAYERGMGPEEGGNGSPLPPHHHHHHHGGY